MPDKLLIKKCKHCQTDISNNAKRCPNCHGDLRIWPMRHPFIVIVLLFIILVFLWPGLRDLYRFYIKSPKPLNESAEQETQYLLELKNVTYTKEKDTGFIITEGLITNISSKSISDVLAVVQLYDDNDNFIKSADALIEYNPILSGQSSPFKVITSDNPAIQQGKIEFKYFSGGTISTKRQGDEK